MGDWEIRRMPPARTACTCRICADLREDRELREQAEQANSDDSKFSGIGPL